MASAATPSTPSSGGVGASAWASQPPSKPGWGRSGEPGSAFRGMTRGRPGRGVGRGGRTGRGGSKVGGSDSSRTEDKTPKPNGNPFKESIQDTSPTASAPPPAPALLSSAVASVLSKPSVINNRPKDSKPPARKASDSKPARKLPPIVVDPPPAPSSNSPVSAVSAMTPSRSRRKRSTNQAREAASIPSKKSPSGEVSSTHLQPERSPVIVKDLPPHLAPPPPPETPSFDIKHDIDALVERVRAVAMDRPNTPGSHIDWAGEDDDSLPDLDDWGVTSVTDKNSVPPEQPDLISPILADALRPLPNIEFGSPLVPLAGSPAQQGSPAIPPIIPPKVPPEVEAEENTPRTGQAHSQPPSSKTAETTTTAKTQTPAKKETTRKKSDAAVKLPNSIGPRSSVDKDGSVKKSLLKQSNFSLHPSLPAKPVDAIDALTKWAPHNPPPVQSPEAAADIAVESGTKPGLFESMHAPKSNDSSAQEQTNDSSPEPESRSQGISSSMHAPVRSAPSHITTHASVSMPSFHPTHGRAHTVGRPNGLRVNPSNGSFPDGSTERASRSTKDRINHARNHSSPPVGPGTSTAHSRTVHASRPVITVGALSRLARDLGVPTTTTKRANAEPTTTASTSPTPSK